MDGSKAWLFQLSAFLRCVKEMSLSNVQLARHLRYAARSLRKSPGFTAVGIITLAIGIGATTLAWSVLDAVVLRPLPCPHPDRMFAVVESHPQRGKLVVRPANYTEWTPRAAWLDRSGVMLRIDFVFGGDDRHVAGALVDRGFFATWDVAPQFGRAFGDGDYVAGAPEFFGARGAAVILSDRFYESRFAGDGTVLGRTIALDGAAFTVVGVMPPSFRAIANVDVFVPWVIGPAERNERRFHYFPVIARLKAGVSPSDAQRDLSALYRSLAAEHKENADWTAQLIAPKALLLGTTPDVLMLLFGAASLVMIMACANVANLLVARGIGRRREIAIRMALGSSRSELVAEDLALGGLLALAGALFGLAVAAAGVSIVSTLPSIADLPFAFVPTIDLRVLAFAASVCVSSVLLISVFPSMAQSRVDVLAALKGPRPIPGSAASRNRAALVVVQVALGIVVVVTTILMTRSLLRLQQVAPGIDVANVLTLRIEASERRYGDADLPRLYARILDRVRSLPGTRAAALTGYLPLTDPGRTWRFSIEGRPSSASGDEYFAVPAEVTTDLFATLGIAKIEGRLFERTDTGTSPGVVVISRTAARRFWPAVSPIGQRIRIAGIDRVYSIVGVVADVHQATLQDEPAPMLYTLLAQTPEAARSTWLVAKTATDPLASTKSVRDVIHAIDPSIPIDDVQSMDVVRGTTLDQPRFRTLMLASFAVVALLLSAVGLYAVLAQFVGERRFEIGVRMALGATRRDAVNFAVGQAGRLVAVGLAAGGLMAVASAQLIRGLLFHVSALDLPAFVLAASMFLLVAAAATWLPARHAADVDPAIALRAD